MYDYVVLCVMAWFCASLQIVKSTLNRSERSNWEVNLRQLDLSLFRCLDNSCLFSSAGLSLISTFVLPGISLMARCRSQSELSFSAAHLRRHARSGRGVHHVKKLSGHSSMVQRIPHLSESALKQAAGCQKQPAPK